MSDSPYHDDLFSAEPSLGLFEINQAGTVLLSRAESNEDNGPGPDLAGKNFFTEVAPSENKAELQLRICDFVDGSRQADSFYLNYHFATGQRRVKVLLGRVRDGSNGGNTRSVLVHLRTV